MPSRRIPPPEPPAEPAAALPERAAAQFPVTRLERGASLPVSDWLAEEVPVAVHYNAEPYAVMMASPVDLEDFAYGFTLTERDLDPRQHIRQVEPHERLEGLELDIHGDFPPPDPAAARRLPGRSGCGLCGQRLLETAIRQPLPLPPDAPFEPLPALVLERALAALRQRQPLNVLTGAVHAAAWANREGELVLLREDVGRHNALDKLIGAMLRQDLSRAEGFLLLTSRASYEMIAKAASAGIAVVVAISAPTALALQLARSADLSLIGFARPGRQVIYHDPRQRIILLSSAT